MDSILNIFNTVVLRNEYIINTFKTSKLRKAIKMLCENNSIIVVNKDWDKKNIISELYV